MKTLILIVTILFHLTSNGQVKVKGYTKSNLTYVAPHMRSRPNSTPTDNYSYPGNTNPYTEKTTKGSTGLTINNKHSQSDFDIYEIVLNYSTMNSLMSKINFSFNQYGDKKISEDNNFVTVTYKNSSLITALVTYTYNGEVEQIVFLMPVNDSKEIVKKLIQEYGTNVIDGKTVIQRNELTYDLHTDEDVGMIIIY